MTEVTTTIIRGSAEHWTGSADFVFTNPCGPLPSCVRGLPMLLTLHAPTLANRRQALAEHWVGGRLELIGYWGPAASLFRVGLPERPIDLSPFAPEESMGAYPLEFCLSLLRLYADFLRPGAVVWDGFAGRATVGRAARMLGYSYVGIERRWDRVRQARAYVHQ